VTTVFAKRRETNERRSKTRFTNLPQKKKARLYRFFEQIAR
jgi:hypothetical protein